MTKFGNALIVICLNHANSRFNFQIFRSVERTTKIAMEIYAKIHWDHLAANVLTVTLMSVRIMEDCLGGNV